MNDTVLKLGLIISVFNIEKDVDIVSIIYTYRGSYLKYIFVITNL